MESGLKSIINWVLDVIFPEKCLGCNIKASIICTHCALLIRRTERETSGGIMAAFDYRDPLIKKAIWTLKYHHRKHVGQKLGELLYNAMIEEVADMTNFTKGQPIYVIPVPLSRTRKKMRGYNQAEAIAKSFCECTTNKICELKNKIIIKKVNTIPQAKITNRNTRLKNIKNAFEIISPSLVYGKTIIIIDDVTTTGGTMTEIIKLLKKSGAKKVVGFAVAH